MPGWIDVLKTVLPVALTLLLGVVCRRMRLLTRGGVDALKTVAVQIGLPAVLLHTFATAEYTPAMLAVPLIMFALCVLAWYLGRCAGNALGMRNRFVPFLTTGFEAGMLGYTLFGLLYPDSPMADFARIDLGQVLFVFTLYKVLIGLDGHERPTARQLAKEMALSPIILAIAAGVLLGATGLYRAMEPSGTAALLDACTDFISAPVSALILIAVGYDLVFRDIRWGSALSAVALRTGIMAVLGTGVFFLFRLLWPGEDWTRPVCLMFLLPPPFVLPVFSEDEDQRAYLSAVLSLSTLLTLAGFAVLAVIG